MFTCLSSRTSSILSKDHPPDKKPKSDKSSLNSNEFDPTGKSPTDSCFLSFDLFLVFIGICVSWSLPKTISPMTFLTSGEPGIRRLYQWSWLSCFIIKYCSVSVPVASCSFCQLKSKPVSPFFPNYKLGLKVQRSSSSTSPPCSYY